MTWRRSWSVVALLVTTAACSAILGIGDLPASDTGNQGDASDASGDGLSTSDATPGDSSSDAAADSGNVSCTTSCHGDAGALLQWQSSRHSAPLTPSIGPGGCGNCHAPDGLALRVAGVSSTTSDPGSPIDVAKGHLTYKSGTGQIDEIDYAGVATGAPIIGCSTCHDANAANDPHTLGTYVAGQWPLRVPFGAGDNVLLEKTADAGAPSPVGQPFAYRTANNCVFCHKSNRDVTFLIAAPVTILSVDWGPHSGPQADIFSAKGGYEVAGLSYGTSTHAVASSCVACHMAPVADGGVPDHSMKVKVAACQACHVTATDFNYGGGQSTVLLALAELQAALNTANLLTRATSGGSPPALSGAELADKQFQLDNARPGGVISTANAGALYDYLLIARGRDLGVHNPTYTKQLLWDSIKQITGGNPTSLTSRP